MPLSINYKELPTTPDGCGQSAQNAAIFLREGLEALDQNKDGALSPAELKLSPQATAKLAYQFLLFKKAYHLLKSKGCDLSQTKLQPLFRRGEAILRPLGFKCSEGFWSCSRPTSSSSSQAAKSVGPFKNKDELEEALFDSEIFGEEKYSIYQKQKNNPHGYLKVALALGEIRSLLLRGSGNIDQAVKYIQDWLNTDELRKDHKGLNIAHHARVRVIEILKRIQPQGSEYDQVVTTLLKTLKDKYPNNKQKPVGSPIPVTTPKVVAIPRKKAPLEFVFEYEVPTSSKAKRVDTVGDFRSSYRKFFQDTLRTAFLIDSLRATLEVAVVPESGKIVQISFANVFYEGKATIEQVKAVLGSVAAKIRVEYRFKQGEPEIFKEPIDFIQVKGN